MAIDEARKQPFALQVNGFRLLAGRLRHFVPVPDRNNYVASDGHRFGVRTIWLPGENPCIVENAFRRVGCYGRYCDTAEDSKQGER